MVGVRESRRKHEAERGERRKSFHGSLLSVRQNIPGPPEGGTLRTKNPVQRQGQAGQQRSVQRIAGLA